MTKAHKKNGYAFRSTWKHTFSRACNLVQRGGRSKKVTVVVILLVIFLLHQYYTNFVIIRVAVYRMHFRAGVHGLLPSADTSEGALFHQLETMGVELPNGGCLWDVGANNGVWVSNSYFLLHTKGYTGFLYEPGYDAFSSLVTLYGNRPTVPEYLEKIKDGPVSIPIRPVILNNIALNGRTGNDVVTFRTVPNGLGSSFRSSNTFDKQHKALYHIGTTEVEYMCKEYRDAIQKDLCTTSTTSLRQHLQVSHYEILDDHGLREGQRIKVVDEKLRGSGSGSLINGEKKPTTTTVLSIDTEGEGESIMQKLLEECNNVSFDIVISESVSPELMEKHKYTMLFTYALNRVWIGPTLQASLNNRIKENKSINKNANTLIAELMEIH